MDAASENRSSLVGSADKSRGAPLAPLPPRERSTLVQNVVDAVRGAIVTQQIPAGERLNQVQIAEQLGVSRMPVREAIATLSSEGLVEPLRTGGVIVKELRRADVRDVYQVRLALESGAARLVAESESVAAVSEIEHVLNSHKLAIPHYTTDQLLAVDSLFHRTILKSTGNPHFIRALVPVWSVVERAMYQVLQVPEIISTVWAEHEGIADAMRDGDPELADQRIRQHLEHGARAVSALLEE